MKWIFLGLLLLILNLGLSGQTNQSTYSLTIKKASDQITVDGWLSESSWETAEMANDFWEKSPRDDRKAQLKTEAKLTYDQHFVYAGFICYDTTKTHIIQTLKRDESVWDNDAVALVLDPINEATTGFFFGANSAGSQNEALLGGGSGEDNYSDEWDNKWYVETQQFEGYWVAEFAIPFKTLRFDPTSQIWGVNFVRVDPKHNQLHAWARVPRQFWVIDLGYTGQLHWDAVPPKTKSNISIIPYLSASFDQDKRISEDIHTGFGVGADAKIALSPSLNLDLTVNPDFSQVEVDQQVTNLTRFSIFFPERRNFFLENSDIFTGFGNPLIRPFFSRRIGLSENGEPVPIQLGARLSGNVTDNLRIGILDVHTGKKGDHTDAQNYFTAAFSQRLFKRSKLDGIFINRQGFDGSETIDQDYGRNAGLELTLQSQDGKWSGWSSYHLSMKPGIEDENTYLSLGGQYTGQVLNTAIALASIGTNFYADVGFVNRIFQYDAANDQDIRQGYKFLFWPVELAFVPKASRSYQQINVAFENFILFNPDYNRTESNHEIGFEVEFVNSSSFEVGVSMRNEKLQYPFSFTDGVPLPAGTYQFTNVGVEYNSDERKLFNYSVGYQAGGFYNGTIHNVELEVNFRQQPWGLFSMNAEYNDIKFPDEYGATRLWLIGPRLEFSFSRNLFWSTFLQYNTQADNFNINSRFQWQFQPLSWIYLVYTDNYLTTNWSAKSRALVFKVNYWLSL